MKDVLPQSLGFLASVLDVAFEAFASFWLSECPLVGELTVVDLCDPRVGTLNLIVGGGGYMHALRFG